MRMIALGAAGLALAACGTTTSTETSTEPFVNRSAEISSLMAADRAWSAAVEASANPDEAFAAGLEGDAVVLTPGAPRAEGRAAIAELVYQMASSPGYSLYWEPVTADVSEDATLGYTMGVYEQTGNDSNGYPTTTRGKYVTMWRKQLDGSWLVTADATTSNGPPITALK